MEMILEKIGSACNLRRPISAPQILPRVPGELTISSSLGRRKEKNREKQKSERENTEKGKKKKIF
jgi:hypothetical protein